MESHKKILLIDFTNYEDYPVGGFLSFARNMISSFGNDLALIGITTEDNEPVGKWYTKQINGSEFDFFSLARYVKNRTKHIIPDRVTCFLKLKYYRNRILQKDFNNVFVQRHEVLPAISNFGYKNVCYRFPGMESPLSISKYGFGRYFSGYFDRLFFSALKNVQLILAAGDDNSIDEMIERSTRIISRSSVIKFPTRIDTDIFRPADKLETRIKLNIRESVFMVITTGRLAWFKGWKFMIDCFSLFQNSVPDSLFYMIGDGEDEQKIREYLYLKHLENKVILTGRKLPDEISLYLNSSDLFIMGSYKEGWSTSLSEAIACGIPSCVTAFSSANEIIREGVNGYVVREHDEKLFVEGMIKSLSVPRPADNRNVLSYSTGKLKEDILRLWYLV